jgi:hypothetical protein
MPVVYPDNLFSTLTPVYLIFISMHLIFSPFNTTITATAEQMHT